MRFKRRLALSRGLDITPLVDMVFNLMIFFMLTSSFIFQPGIKINLPKAITSEVLHEQSIVVTIMPEGLLYLNNKPISTKELALRLKEAAKESKPLLIKADSRASLGRVVEIWDMCRACGLTKVNIATTPEARRINE